MIFKYIHQTHTGVVDLAEVAALRDHIQDRWDVSHHRPGEHVDAVIKQGWMQRRAGPHQDHDRIRVASIYYNPDDRSTWTVQPVIREPHYYLKRVSQDVIYPQSYYRLPDPARDLRRLNPELADLLFSPSPPG